MNLLAIKHKLIKHHLIMIFTARTLYKLITLASTVGFIQMLYNEGNNFDMQLFDCITTLETYIIYKYIVYLVHVTESCTHVNIIILVP